jgi:hypothetical protein
MIRRNKMLFTKEEQRKLIENCKSVISVIEKEYSPKLRTKVSCVFDVECRTKELRVLIEPNQKVSIYRGEEYFFKPVENNPYRYFFSEKNSDVQMVFLRNWPEIKIKLLNQIERG